MSTSRAMKRARAGFSLIETLMVMVVLAIGLGGMASVLGYTTALVQVDQETTRAANAAADMAETLRSADFPTLFARYNSDPTDDPGAPGSAAGRGFAVEGLQAVAGDADGLVGEIVFPTAVGAGGALELREDVADVNLGTPRDLNGDALIDAADHADDYLILPVVVRLRWRGTTGERRFEFTTVLVNGN